MHLLPSLVKVLIQKLCITRLHVYSDSPISLFNRAAHRKSCQQKILLVLCLGEEVNQSPVKIVLPCQMDIRLFPFMKGASPMAQRVKNLPAMWRPGFNPWVGKIPWRRERLLTPVFWPEEFHGLYSPWGRKELDMTE